MLYAGWNNEKSSYPCSIIAYRIMNNGRYFIRLKVKDNKYFILFTSAGSRKRSIFG